MDNNSPGGFERDIEKGGININARVLKNTALKASYNWENINRNNYNDGSTHKKIFRVTANQRISRNIRLHLKYEKTNIDDPFITRDRIFQSLAQTSIPKTEDDIYGSLNCSIRPDLSINTSLRYYKGKHHNYDIDENRYEFCLSAWYAPFENMTMTVSYSIIDNEVDTPASYKTYHSKGYSSLLIYDDVPYDDRSQIYYISAGYQIRPRVSLTGDITYIISNADFDTKLGSSNVGNFSNLEIDQIETSLGITFDYSPKITLYAKYLFRKYDDREENYLDGQFTLVNFGMSYKFR
jgi:hypothetical protein